MRPHVAAVLLLLSLPSLASAGAFADRPFWVALGGSFGGGLPSSPADALGTGAGNLSLGLRLLPVVPEFTLREGFAGTSEAVTQHRGGLAAGVRFLMPRLLIVRPSFRVAFNHEHRAPLQLFKEKPFAVLFGTADGIDHRTGLETGGGLEVYLDPKSLVRLWAQGTLTIHPGVDEDVLGGLWEVGVAFGIGPNP